MSTVTIIFNSYSWCLTIFTILDNCLSGFTIWVHNFNCVSTVFVIFNSYDWWFTIFTVFSVFTIFNECTTCYCTSRIMCDYPCTCVTFWVFTTFSCDWWVLTIFTILDNCLSCFAIWVYNFNCMSTVSVIFNSYDWWFTIFTVNTISTVFGILDECTACYSTFWVMSDYPCTCVTFSVFTTFCCDWWVLTVLDDCFCCFTIWVHNFNCVSAITVIFNGYCRCLTIYSVLDNCFCCCSIWVHNFNCVSAVFVIFNGYDWWFTIFTVFTVFDIDNIDLYIFRYRLTIKSCCSFSCVATYRCWSTRDCLSGSVKCYTSRKTCFIESKVRTWCVSKNDIIDCIT